ncbi:MAG: excinuclease ABC subunit UvrA [Bacteroidia bacterium]|nr:excinuclease ABC subunit UvrA [Bacteroidia bacterium]MDW8235531.1 excinuclease ABC subunit UvrA [Bacteroidia bacterium]
MTALPSTIKIVGARQHTLKNITVEIPRHKLTVLCGWSGSGKTTLAFDTLYAEGFSSYVESLSTYIRQFLPRMPRPAVERIEGLAPAIALAQNRFVSGQRSTVATLSELYPYLRLLFARVGTLYSPISGDPVERYTLEEVLQFILQQPEGTEIWLLRPVPPDMKANSLHELAEKLANSGYDRFFYAGRLYEYPEFPTEPLEDTLYLVADRVFIDHSEAELRARIMDTLEEIWYAHDRRVWVYVVGKGEFSFSGHLYADGHTFQEPTSELFNYLSSYGACPKCQGKGKAWSLLPAAVIPNPRLSLKDGLVALWCALPELRAFEEEFIQQAAHLIPPDLPYYRYTSQQKRLLWWGDPLKGIRGIFGSYEFLERERSKIREIVAFFGEGPCPMCEGSRLHPDTRWVRIQGTSLPQVLSMTLEEFQAWLQTIDLPEPKRSIAAPLLEQLSHRTNFLLQVGLDYLTLDRAAETLSGGESQRLQLATVLGSQLTGAIYVLDEPTIGLHARDTQKLIRAIRKLQQAPNTVVVVEHDEAFLRAADYIIEMGPEAGEKGGEVVFTGTFPELLQRFTQTAKYLRRHRWPPVGFKPMHDRAFLHLRGACLHNLKNISVSIPFQAFTVITGVSGSGKTTLAIHLLASILSSSKRSSPKYGADKKYYQEIPLAYRDACEALLFDYPAYSGVTILTQDSIPRNRRSVIATLTWAYECFRELFSLASEEYGQALSISMFSFNNPGGRCPTCEGEGVITRSMQFMADLQLPCPSCGGKRFQNFILDIKVGGKSISDILEMTAEEAIDFVQKHPSIPARIRECIISRLSPLREVGLSYLRLGQSTVELSGGEATRLRLLSYLRSGDSGQVFFIDEPTTGLHFDDVERLISAFRELVNKGHTLIVIEHNLDLIAKADWVIDLGPEGGERGGEVVYQGPVRGLLEHPTSHTAAALRDWYANNRTDRR